MTAPYQAMQQMNTAYQQGTAMRGRMRRPQAPAALPPGTRQAQQVNDPTAVVGYKPIDYAGMTSALGNHPATNVDAKNALAQTSAAGEPYPPTQWQPPESGGDGNQTSTPSNPRRVQARMANSMGQPAPAPVPRSVITAQPIGQPMGNQMVNQMGDTAPPAENVPFVGGMVNTMANPMNPTGAQGQTGNPALDATYIGRSGGKARYAGPDGQQYTNKQRELAAQQRDATIDNNLQNVMGQQLGGQLSRQGGFQLGQDRALANMDAAGQRLANYSPQWSMGFNPAELANMTPGRNDAQNFDDLRNFASDQTAGVSTAALDNYNPTALQGFNSGALKNYNAGAGMQSYLRQTGGYGNQPAPDIQAAQNGYDAGASVNEYARGAAGQARFALEEALRNAENSAAAGGRLDSGLFDRDKGLVIQNVGRDLNDKISQAAVQAAGIQAGIGNNNASLGTQANIARGNLAGNLMQNRENLRSSEARTASQIGADALSNALGLDQRTASDIDSNRLSAANYGVNARLNKAQSMDQNRLQGLDAASRLQLNQAQYGDTFRQQNTRDALDMQRQNNNYLDTQTLNGANSYGDFSRGAADLYGALNQNTFNNINDLAASERDRITGNRNAIAARNAQREQNKYGLIGAGLNLAGQAAGSYFGGR